MVRENIDFKNSDGVTLRGWFYRPENAGSSKLPALVMAHGFSALKDMTVDLYAEAFVSALSMCVLLYDHRGFGDSDHLPGQPRGEVVPTLQISDYSDAITYASTRPEVDSTKIGIWGTSFSGGHVLVVAAIDRRVKVVLSQVPCVSGWDNFHRLVRPDLIQKLEESWAADRIARQQGKEPGYLPIVSPDPFGVCALNGKEGYEYCMQWEGKSSWKNETTVRTMELFRAYDPQQMIDKISPTPLLLTIGTLDNLTPPDLALAAYARAREPKELQLLPVGHYDVYAGETMKKNISRQIEFLKKWFVGH